MKPSLQTDFAGISFKNPLVLASGTCGFGGEYSEYFDIRRLGGLCSKGLTLKAREGNGGIRIWETPGGIMNSVGLENPGAEAFIREELPRMRTLGPVIIVNLGGHSLEDYLAGAELLNNAGTEILELNISCPNLKAGGMNFGIKAETAREVVRKIRGIFRGKLVVKLSPNAEDILALARACEEEGADGISLVNTFLALAVDIRKRRPVFDNTYAGLSGPAIKPIALRMVHQVARGVSIPVMGMGGITNWQDAIEFIMAGARIIQIGTASFMKPSASMDILDGMEAWLCSQGIQNIEDIRGCI
jgi:dihydroorotate dehydrogenase (NAD+) catalytic subunit